MAVLLAVWAEGGFVAVIPVRGFTTLSASGFTFAAFFGVTKSLAVLAFHGFWNICVDWDVYFPADVDDFGASWGAEGQNPCACFGSYTTYSSCDLVCFNHIWMDGFHFTLSYYFEIFLFDYTF